MSSVRDRKETAYRGPTAFYSLTSSNTKVRVTYHFLIGQFLEDYEEEENEDYDEGDTGSGEDVLVVLVSFRKIFRGATRDRNDRADLKRGKRQK